MRKLIVVGSLLFIAGVAQANNGESFATGFANGLSQALAARQGYQYQQQEQPDYSQSETYVQQEEQLRLLREQVELLRQQLQQSQTEEINRQWWPNQK